MSNAQYLLMTERINDLDWANFIEENNERFLQMFSNIYQDIAGGEDEESILFGNGNNNDDEDDDEHGNFFALKELMKLQYQMLTKKEECFMSMKESWVSDKASLRQVMKLMEYEDDALIYECILQLSLFFRKEKSEEIKRVLMQNSDALIEIIGQFNPGNSAGEDYYQLKSAMLR